MLLKKLIDVTVRGVVFITNRLVLLILILLLVYSLSWSVLAQDQFIYHVQVGAYYGTKYADIMLQNLTGRGFSPFMERRGDLYFVFAGSSPSYEGAHDLLDNLQEQGIDGIIIRTNSNSSNVENSFPSLEKFILTLQPETFYIKTAYLENLSEASGKVTVKFFNGEVDSFHLIEETLVEPGLSWGESIDFVLNTNDQVLYLAYRDLRKQHFITLEYLGYSSDIKLLGTNPSFLVFVPVNESISLSETSIFLDLAISPVLKKDSTLTILVNDSFLFAAPILELASDDYRIRRVIPLQGVSLDKADNLLKIEFITYLNISDNRCLDINSGNLWLTINKNSGFNLVDGQKFFFNIRNYLDGYYDQVTLGISSPFDEKMAAEYIKLHADISRLLLHAGINIQQNVYVSHNPLLNPQHRKIYLTQAGEEIYLDRALNLIAETGAIETLTAPDHNFLLGRRFTIVSSDLVDFPKRRSLSELGYASLEYKGVAEMGNNIDFTISDIGGWPRQIRFIMSSIYTPLPKNTEDLLYLKAYLNDVLIHAEELSGRGSIESLIIDLPVKHIEQENNLHIVFAYYPFSGDCHGIKFVFEGILKDSSYLEIQGRQKTDELIFERMLGDFMGPGVVILPDGKDPFYLFRAAEMISVLRKLDNIPVEVEVIFLKDLEDTRDASWFLFALPSNDLNDFQPNLISRHGQISIFNPATGKELFHAEPEENLAVAQLFHWQGKPSIALSYSGNEFYQLQGLTAKLLEVNTFRRLFGNLALYKDGELVTFLLGPELKLVEDHKFSLQLFIQTYRLYILLLSIIVLALIAYIVYKKLGTAKATQ